jgi:hypothetical protein
MIAYGAEKVREIERAMGGTPPSSVLKESQAFLQRYVAERRKQRQANLAEVSRRAEGWRELLLRDVSKDDPRLKKLKEQSQAAMKRQKQRKIVRPKLVPPKIEARMGAKFVLRVPPYDGTEVTGDIATADASTGSCTLNVESFGDGNKEAVAALGVWYYSPEDNPTLHFTARVDYYDSWFNVADFYVGHNDMRTRAWAWGSQEEAWVLQSDFSPSWSDGASWLDYHENSDQGGSWIDTYFPVEGNGWYLVWVWFDASVYADSGFGGGAFSGISFECAVPIITFGNIF